MVKGDLVPQFLGNLRGRLRYFKASPLPPAPLLIAWWGLVICSLGGAFTVFAMVFEGARRSFLSSRWSVWRAGGVLRGKLGTWVDYGSVSSLKIGPR